MVLRMLGLTLSAYLAASPGAKKDEGVSFLSAEALKAFSGKLAAKEPMSLTGKRMRAAFEQLSDRGSYNYLIIRRDETGEAEVHASWDDIFVVVDGSGTVIHGGQVKGGHETWLGEQRGGEIVGGASQKIAAGDLLIIPSGIPHQVQVSSGSFVTYFVVKLRKAPADH